MSSRARAPLAALLLLATSVRPLAAQAPESARDADAAVRERAAAELAAGGAASIPALAAALADPDPFVGGAAADALARIGPASVPALLRSLEDARPGVRTGAAIALGKLGSGAADAVPALAKALAELAERAGTVSGEDAAPRLSLPPARAGLSKAMARLTGGKARLDKEYEAGIARVLDSLETMLEKQYDQDN